MINKYAVRSVVFDNEMNTAILSVYGGRYYKIPGGGIEDGETEIEALHREIKEEAGCEVKVLDKISSFSVYNEEKDTTFHSECYVSTLNSKRGEPSFDKDELDHNYKLIWINANEAIKMMEKAITIENGHEAIIHNRDLNFLKKGKEYIDKLRLVDAANREISSINN